MNSHVISIIHVQGLMQLLKTNQIVKKIILGTAQFGVNYGVSNNRGKLKKKRNN